VHACAEAVELPIVGMGGIASAAHVRDFVAVGASAVALGTNLFADPWAPERIREELDGGEPAATDAPAGPRARIGRRSQTVCGLGNTKIPAN
jgi:2,4-dienoyl-CoA reductase-like NADH-dependent reductase (Old Yellow Enzyme family)